jgi:predicted ArsR family transcriptional regulator
MLEDRTEQGLADLAVLAEPVRRRIYLHVLRRADAVSRDEAANALGIGRSLAAFHLDRLVEAGLLETEFRRLSGRTGPGAGRPSKLYRASPHEVRAVVPERRYEVAAELFAQALSAPNGGSTDLGDVARTYGTELGTEARRRAGQRARPQRRLEALASVLRDAGYVPFQRDGELRMLNCPFHELSQRHRELTCGMNLALCEGMLEGANLSSDAARLDWQPGLCCVAIRSDKIAG